LFHSLLGAFAPTAACNTLPMPTPPAPSTRIRGRLARLLAALTAAYTLVLVLATHYPRPEEFLGKNPPSDKALHFMAYGALAVLAAGTLAVARRWTTARAAGLGAFLATFAAIDEVTQPLFSRAAEPLDWVSDCTGIGLGLAGVALVVAVVRLVRGRYAQLGVGGR
jgi:VanZ family protein